MAEPTIKQKIGRLGEDIAVKHLENKGFSIICLNYRKKCGEIDIIARKRGITHFIEVKTVSEPAGSGLGRSVTPKEFWQNTYDSHRRGLGGVSGSADGSPGLCLDARLGRSVTDRYRPEDNIHPTKLKRLARTIQLYLYEKHKNGEPEWQFDVITVRMDVTTKQAKVEYLENIII